jgi:hypothetical protein
VIWSPRYYEIGQKKLTTAAADPMADSTVCVVFPFSLHQNQEKKNWRSKTMRAGGEKQNRQKRTGRYRVSNKTKQTAFHHHRRSAVAVKKSGCEKEAP